MQSILVFLKDPKKLLEIKDLHFGNVRECQMSDEMTAVEGDGVGL